MKNTLKLFLILALFCSTAFADGNMTGTGFTDGSMGGGGFTDGNMGSGGKTCTGNCIADGQTTGTTDDSSATMIKFIRDYLKTIFG